VVIAKQVLIYAHEKYTRRTFGDKKLVKKKQMDKEKAWLVYLEDKHASTSE